MDRRPARPVIRARIAIHGLSTSVPPIGAATMTELPRHDFVGLSVDPRRAAVEAQEYVDHPFKVVVIGDFSARGEGASGPRRGEPRLNRLTSVDEALARIRPSVSLEAPGGVKASVTFQELEDFHPDRLLAQVEHLAGPADGSGEPEPDAPPEPPAKANRGEGRPERDSSERVPSGSGLLDDIVEAAEAGSEADAGALADLRSWISDVVEPHLRNAQGRPGTGEAGRREAELASLVRSVLHHPAVRSLERSWRSLLVVAKAAAAVENVDVFFLDLDREALRAALAAEDVEDAPLSPILDEARDVGDPTPVGLLVGCYEFGATPEDVSLLNRIAIVASSVGAPWIAAAKPSLLGLESFAEPSRAPRGSQGSAAWTAFRETAGARSVALLAPGFLLREPYGPDSEPCEKLAFQELPEPDPTQCLWGNPSILGAAAAIAQFARGGWRLDLDVPHDLDPMPIHVDAEGEAIGPAEVIWSLDFVERVRGAGVSPVLGYRDQARLRVPAITSASWPPGPLEAWWAS